MSLEEEIKFNDFKNNRQKVLVNIYFTNNWLFHKYQSTLKKFELTAQQYNIVRILDERYPKSMSIGEIRERMLDRSSDITRIIDRLKTKNLLVKRSDQKNKRKTNVRLNIIGRELAKQMEDDINRFQMLTESLSDNEIDKLNELLDKIRVDA